MKEFIASIEDYTRAIELDSSYAPAYYNRGISKYELKDSDGAFKDFNKAIKLDSNFASAYNNRGALKYDLKTTIKQLRIYLKLLN